MNIAPLGATGSVGSELLTEALNRGPGIARHREKLRLHPHLMPKPGDLGDAARPAGVLDGHDVVFSAVRFLNFDAWILLSAVQQPGVPRLLTSAAPAASTWPQGPASRQPAIFPRNSNPRRGRDARRSTHCVSGAR